MSSISAEFTNLQPSSDERVSSPLAHGRTALMLCDDVKRVMYFFLDGSLGDSKRQTIELHLHDCPDCEVRIIVHRKMRSFFRRRLSGLPAPDSLRVRLTQSLRTATAE
jgi:mycothiol system anti-sigma-R factor